MPSKEPDDIGTPGEPKTLYIDLSSKKHLFNPKPSPYDADYTPNFE
jgi:hypothetical protein